MKSKAARDDNPFAVLTRGLKFQKKEEKTGDGKRSSTVA
jgi:hypothetical protein